QGQDGRLESRFPSGPRAEEPPVHDFRQKEKETGSRIEAPQGSTGHGGQCHQYHGRIAQKSQQGRQEIVKPPAPGAGALPVGVATSYFLMFGNGVSAPRKSCQGSLSIAASRVGVLGMVKWAGPIACVT